MKNIVLIGITAILSSTLVDALGPGRNYHSFRTRGPHGPGGPGFHGPGGPGFHGPGGPGFHGPGGPGFHGPGGPGFHGPGGPGFHGPPHHGYQGGHGWPPHSFLDSESSEPEFTEETTNSWEGRSNEAIRPNGEFGGSEEGNLGNWPLQPPNEDPCWPATEYQPSYTKPPWSKGRPFVQIPDMNRPSNRRPCGGTNKPFTTPPRTTPKPTLQPRPTTPESTPQPTTKFTPNRTLPSVPSTEPFRPPTPTTNPWTNKPTRTPLPTEPTTPSFGGDSTAEQITGCIAQCYATDEYNPVCGTDGITYKNVGKLNCAKTCGVKVEVRRKSACPKTPQPMSTVSTTPSTTPSSFRTTDLTSYQRCMKQCAISPNYEPICGTDFVTYVNKDRLNCARQCGEVINILCDKPCSACINEIPTTSTQFPTSSPTTTEKPVTYPSDVDHCYKNCLSTPEYNPVCGTNGITYSNPGRLLCAQICGIDVKVARLYPCSSFFKTTTTTSSPTISSDLSTCLRKCPTTSEFKPVCGSNNITYYNPSRLDCAIYCGVHVQLAKNLPCDEVVVTSTSTTTITTSKPASTPSNLSSTLGFTIPPDVLSSIFGDYTETSTKPATSDEDYGFDVRFGDNNATNPKP